MPDATAKSRADVIRTLRAEGLTLRAICAQLGVAKSAVNRALYPRVRSYESEYGHDRYYTAKCERCGKVCTFNPHSEKSRGRWCAAQDRAYVSADGLYRYSLTREIADPHFGCRDEDERDATVTFVGLNPSTADATQDDPTIRRCVRFAREWGFARMKMVNLYAWRATDPTSLFVAKEAGMDVVGPENDHVISLVYGGSDKIVAAWGATAPDERVSEFIETFDGWQMWALGRTQAGRPRHPLYMRADVVPFVYEVRSAA